MRMRMWLLIMKFHEMLGRKREKYIIITTARSKQTFQTHFTSMKQYNTINVHQYEYCRTNIANTLWTTEFSLIYLCLTNEWVEIGRIVCDHNWFANLWVLNYVAWLVVEGWWKRATTNDAKYAQKQQRNQ